MKNLFFVLFILALLTGCDKEETKKCDYCFTASDPLSDANITGPVGSLLNITPGVSYSFTLTISGVNGVGSFSSSLLATTGTVSLTGLDISFSELTPTGNPNEFTSVGTFSAPFTLTDQGTVEIIVTYTESGILVLNNSLTFEINIIPGAFFSSFEFSPPSPFEIRLLQADATITLINATPSGGTISLSNIDDGGTGGTFILGTELNFIFTTSTTTAVGVASVDVTYNPPAPDVPSTQTFIVNVNRPIFIHPFELSSANGANSTILNGINTSDFAGFSVSAGDINGDGMDDILIGAPQVDPNGNTNAGATYVVFGSTAPFSASLELSALDGNNGFAANGINIGEQSGFSVSAGDINGDGIEDLLIGAPFASPNGISIAGETYVVFGSTAPFSASLELSTLDGMNGFVINGIGQADLSGTSVSIGDINGDGIDDVIIGARGAILNGNLNVGKTYVVFGSTAPFGASLDLSTLDGSNGFIVNGIDSNDQSGNSVSAGDINGDGIDDVIIGARGGDPNGNTTAGETYVVFGSTAPFSTSLDLSALNGNNGFTANGIDMGDQSGSSVSAGDINGDGIEDLLIGAFVAAPNGNVATGETYIVFGSTAPFSASLDLSILDGNNGFTVSTTIPFYTSGYSVSSADIDGDGIDDLITSAPFANPNGNNTAGEINVVLGSTTPFNALFDLTTLDGTNGFTLQGIDSMDNAGTFVDAGDINGDGFADLIIGTYQGDPNGNINAGEVYVVLNPAQQ